MSYDIRMSDLLGSLRRRTWRAGTPKGVGPKTVAKALEYEWVEQDGDRLRLTDRGFRRRIMETEDRTGTVHPVLRDSRIASLRELWGDRVLTAVQEGRAVIKTWRRSTPHNWWVEDLRGRTLWHMSNDQRPRHAFYRVLVAVSHSEDRIWAGVWEDGLPESTTYRLHRRYCRPLPAKAQAVA